MKDDLKGRKYLCGQYLWGIVYKKMVDFCEHVNELGGYTQLHTHL
jgi:hypothetical protein